MRLVLCIVPFILMACSKPPNTAEKIIYGQSFTVDNATLQIRMPASFVDGGKAWTVDELTDEALNRSQSNASAILAKSVKEPEKYHIKEIALQSVSGRLVLFVTFAKSKPNGLEQELTIPVNNRYETLSPQT